MRKLNVYCCLFLVSGDGELKDLYLQASLKTEHLHIRASRWKGGASQWGMKKTLYRSAYFPLSISFNCSEVLCLF